MSHSPERSKSEIKPTPVKKYEIDETSEEFKRFEDLAKKVFSATANKKDKPANDDSDESS